MAKKKTATHSTAMARYRAPAQKAPIVNVRVAQPKKTKSRGRRHGHGKHGLQKAMVASAVGGYAVGFIEKQFPTLPTVPVIGKKGTIAIIGFLLSGKGGMIGTIARDVAMVSAGLAGYEFATTGKVSGETVRQVSGLASQV